MAGVEHCSVRFNGDLVAHFLDRPIHLVRAFFVGLGRDYRFDFRIFLYLEEGFLTDMPGARHLVVETLDRVGDNFFLARDLEYP